VSHMGKEVQEQLQLQQLSRALCHEMKIQAQCVKSTADTTPGSYIYYYHHNMQYW
jgi:hypothetical protein